MSKSGQPILRLSPEPWLGVATDFNPKFTEALKGLVDTRSWDRATFTWWMPLSFMTHVLTLIREHAVASDNEVEHSRKAIEIALRGTRKPQLGDGLADAYSTLGLHPSAPPMLVEWAIYYWRKESESIGAPTQRLLMAEEAYRRICGGGSGGRVA